MVADDPGAPTGVDALRDRLRTAPLDPETVDADPMAQLARWCDDARAAAVPEPEAMTLATVDADGHPSARTVLLRGLDGRGLVFYSNYRSAKAADLGALPFAAVVLHWKELARQVRVTGPVAKASPQESDAYWARRPRGSRIAAWASPQSEVLASRADLDARVAAAASRFAGTDPPRPTSWGGYRLEPRTVELWAGRPDRLHDRVRYARGPAGRWRRERLAP